MNANIIQKLTLTLAEKPVKKMLIVNRKAIVSGDMVEIYEYESPIAIRLDKKPAIIGSGGSTATAKEKAEIIKKRALDSYNDFMRLVIANFTKNRTKFLTLTFADTDKFDVRSVYDCNKKLKEFIQRLRWKYGTDWKYVAAIEFQDKKGRGAVHYHIMLDLPYIEKEILNEIWGYGTLTIKAVQDAKHGAIYVGKYMRKGLIDDRLARKKKYHGSHNLVHPRELYNDQVDALLKRCEGKEKNFENTYVSKFHGSSINYTKYFL